jgi:hypothetical protein
MCIAQAGISPIDTKAESCAQMASFPRASEPFIRMAMKRVMEFPGNLIKD